MSHQEKNVYAALAGTLLIFGVFAWRILVMYQAGRFDGPEASALVGRSFLFLVLAGIAVNIVLTIVFNILHAIATNDPRPDFSVDERDRLIELQGSRSFLVVFSIGFIAAMLALALGAPPAAVFLAIILAMFLGSVADDVTKIFYYRRGF